MKVLAHGEWNDGYLDYHRPENDYRIQVVAWLTLARVEDLYFVRPRSIRLVYNYLREVGGREVLRKIGSRTEERTRNDKYISCGLGRIVEQGLAKEFAVGQDVVFVAPSHPACVDRIVLPAALLVAAPADLAPAASYEALRYSTLPLTEEAGGSWFSLAGWSPYSGVELPSCVPQLLDKAVQFVRATDWGIARQLPSGTETPVYECSGYAIQERPGRKKSAVLVGYGNYAKTVILPNVRHNIDVKCVHEIDPTQIPRSRGGAWVWDTSGSPREGKTYDAWIIAGYHHTHAPLAIKALESGSYAVVEKPLATTRDQLDALARTVRKTPLMFAGFHKRYSPMNDWARSDLGVPLGEAISYHCIVYEVPLPTRHWYRWPNSRSRIVSNGCHWIDHFLFLNGYPPVDELDVQHSGSGTVSCFVTLRNGACFTLVLTDEGATRIGVQEHVELRANGRTVRMTDGSSYRSEDSSRVLRRARVHKYSGFRKMYRIIGRAIERGEAGDSPESIIASTEMVLTLEELLQRTHA